MLQKPHFKLVKLRIFVFCLGCLLFFTSCATTTGPKVSGEEVEKAKKELEVKAFKFKVGHFIKVNEIGHHLVQNLPPKGAGESNPFTGLLTAKVDKIVKRAYNLPEEKGVVVIGSVKDSPAAKSGLQEGDLILSINNKKTKSPGDVGKIISDAKPGDVLGVKVLRAGQEQGFSLDVVLEPLKVAFQMVEDEMVNAGATPEMIIVTYGMMKFIKSDDELACVLGHELAHITKGHHAKGAGTGLLSVLLGIPFFIAGEAIAPGAGDDFLDIAASAFQAKFSRDFEREADYFGLKYAYGGGYNIEIGAGIWERFAIELPESMNRDLFSSHPSSPERMLRLQKTVEEIKAGTDNPPEKEEKKEK